MLRHRHQWATDKVPTVWVTSLPRSLSSATMRVLAQGCDLTAFQDAFPRENLPHGANPHGFFESSALNRRPVETLQGLDLDGHCLKVFARNVRPLLAAGIAPTHDILLRRPIADILASWDRWFPKLYRSPTNLAANLEDAERALGEYDVSTLVIQTRDLIADPTEWCGRINEFLGDGFDVARMAALIDPSLYHPHGSDDVHRAARPTRPEGAPTPSLPPFVAHLRRPRPRTRRRKN